MVERVYYLIVIIVIKTSIKYVQLCYFPFRWFKQLTVTPDMNVLTICYYGDAIRNIVKYIFSITIFI